MVPGLFSGIRTVTTFRINQLKLMNVIGVCDKVDLAISSYKKEMNEKKIIISHKVLRGMM